MRYAFETFLLLYPASYRNTFGREMASVFAEAAGDHAPCGVMAYLAFLFTEFLGVIAGAFSAWSEEYLHRSRRWLSVRFVFSIIVSTAFTCFYQGCFYAHMPQFTRPKPLPAEIHPLPDYTFLLVTLFAGALLFVSVFSLACVWNMRVIGTRAGRLKPIWMPGRATGARKRGSGRITQRDQTGRPPVFDLEK